LNGAKILWHRKTQTGTFLLQQLENARYRLRCHLDFLEVGGKVNGLSHLDETAQNSREINTKYFYRNVESKSLTTTELGLK
jgi:hypothetical protein